MSERRDAPAFVLTTLLTDAPMVGLSTDDTPTTDADGLELVVGATLQYVDTGALLYWNGSAWKPVTVEQADGLTLSLLFEIRDLLRG